MSKPDLVTSLPPREERTYLTAYEAAADLDVNYQTLVKWCRRGDIKSHKLGFWRIDRQAVETYLATQDPSVLRPDAD